MAGDAGSTGQHVVRFRSVCPAAERLLKTESYYSLWGRAAPLGRKDKRVEEFAQLAVSNRTGSGNGASRMPPPSPLAER